MKAIWEMEQGDIQKAIAAYIGGTKHVNATPANVNFSVLDCTEAPPVELKKFLICARIEVVEK